MSALWNREQYIKYTVQYATLLVVYRINLLYLS